MITELNFRIPDFKMSFFLFPQRSPKSVHHLLRNQNSFVVVNFDSCFYVSYHLYLLTRQLVYTDSYISILKI